MAAGAAGRPRRSSRGTLEDAAAELFLENTYDGTTVDQIAQRAGVSRNTFFNYFSSKSDLLWVDLDASIAELDGVLDAVPDDRAVMAGVAEALVRVAERHPSERVPWALTQFELMGTLDVLQSSGLARFLAVSSVLERYIRRNTDGPATLAGAAASAVTAAAASAAGTWAAAGTGRGSLAPYVAEAIAPVCDGYAPAFPRAPRSE